jgi:hypothetical protein
MDIVIKSIALNKAIATMFIAYCEKKVIFRVKLSKVGSRFLAA